MLFATRLRKRTIGSAATRAARQRCRPTLELLEGRLCPSYLVTDLGTLGPGFSQANAMNDVGQVVGQSDTVESVHAFFWANGVMTDIRLPGADQSYALDVNDLGQAVGYADFLGDGTIPPQHAFLWHDGVFTDFGSGTDAHAINNAGQIVGYRVTVSGEGVGPVLWEDGVMYFLNDLLPAGTPLALAAAMDINEHGQIVGVAYGSGPGAHYFLLSDDDGIYANGGAVLTDLGTQSNWQRARLNNSGQVIAGNFLYSAGAVIDLGFRAEGINDAGQVVGYEPYPGTNALLWQNGLTTNLNYHAFLLTPSATPDLTISDASVIEGNTGTTSVVFTVNLSTPSDQVVTVAYETVTGAAASGSDFLSTAGTLTFAPGEISQRITVRVIGDRRAEPNETFVVNLNGASNAVIIDGQGDGAIEDDEPRISISDVTKAEGRNGKTTLFTFTVTLLAAYDQPVTMSFKTTDGTAKTSDNDYVAKSGTVTFAPGQTTKTITIEVKGDSKKEANETFYLDLFGNSGNSLFTKNRGVATILNDD
jgi:probable HAF family extracellular repeat protein